MYKIPDNSSGAEIHFKDYAEKVKTRIQEYLGTLPSPICSAYTSSFLGRLTTADTTCVGTDSLLERLLIGDFQTQIKLINEIDEELKQEEKLHPGTTLNFDNTMKSLFVAEFYGDRFFFNKEKHIERVGVEVCPYCGRNYIFSVSKRTRTNPDSRVKPQIDHFLPKSKYPYLALNYYNLIPSCTTCNESPCKAANDPIGEDRSHEYLMQPYEFRQVALRFGYVPTTSIYKDFSVSVSMDCTKTEHETGYKEWLALDKLYGKHNAVVTRMYVQLDSLVAERYKRYLKYKFKVPLPFLNEVPKMMFGYDLSDDLAPLVPLHKFRKDIFQQIVNDVGDFDS